MSIEKLVNDIRTTYEQGEDVDARVGFLILSAGRDVYRCPTCGRLIVLGETDDSPEYFVAEEAK